MRSTLSTASLIWRPRISATLCATILQAPVAVLPPPARGRLDRLAVLSEPGSTRARHEPAIGATAETRLVGQRQSLVSRCAKSRGEARQRAQRRGAILRTRSAVHRAVAHPTKAASH